MQAKNLYKILLCVEGIYILLTALWGLIDIKSFMQVTGPKTDIWLVKTVSVLLLPLVACIFFALFFKMDPLAVILILIIASAGLAFIDFYYTSIHTIKWVYALDGIAQLIFILLWTCLLLVIKKLRS